MKILLTATILLTLQSCDAPPRTRYISSETDTTAAGFTTEGGDQSGVSGNQTGGNQVVPAANNYQNDPGFETCNLNYLQSTNNLGNFGICKHSSLESRYKFKMAQAADNNNRTCFVPMHIFSDGSSVAVNTPSADDCKAHAAGQVYDLTLYKDYQHSNNIINGVMVIKESALSGFMSCQTSAANMHKAYTPCRYSDQYNQALCSQQISQHSQYVCGSFVNYNQASYKQVNF